MAMASINSTTEASFDGEKVFLTWERPFNVAVLIEMHVMDIKHDEWYH
jgi:hypothetical protein